MDVIALTQQLEEIVSKNDLTETASILKKDFSIINSKELKNHLETIDDENRVLKIGIIGRVKAGKSSLLNALIFDGQDMLPKAATPMTAALTILQYGEHTHADVDFFTQEDINDISEDAEKYENKLNEIQQKEYEKLKEIKKRKTQKKQLTQEEEKEIREKAAKIATRELKKNDKLFSSYEQYSKIKSSGVTVDQLTHLKSITANNLQELNTQLLDFVGANGKYMPFTKSVTLTIDQESLKDIQIIDTPGVNDPVVSREERTVELLKNCDVVLIVSPAGQFLSSEDLELMDRVTTKEGIRELYLVASQVDNQLYGSEKDCILNKTLQGIEDKLTIQQKDVLSSLKKRHPEVGNTFDCLIDSKVIISSGICYDLLKNFNKKDSWDENMKLVWSNL